MTGMYTVAAPKTLYIQNSRALCFQITVGNFKGWCEAIIERDPALSKLHFINFGSLIKDFHQKGDIVSGEDVVEYLLTNEASKHRLDFNKLYEDLPDLRTEQYARDENGALKRKEKHKAQKQTATAQQENPGPSKRQLRRQRHAALYKQEGKEQELHPK